MARWIGILLSMLSAASARATDYWYFVDSNGGSNSNDGKDPLGLEGGDGQYSFNTATGELTSSSNSFASYTPGASDVLWLKDAASATSNAWYPVLAKTTAQSLLLATTPVAGTALGKVSVTVKPSSGPWADGVICTSGIPECSAVTIWFVDDNAHVGEQHFDSIEPTAAGWETCDWTYRGWPEGTRRRIYSTDDYPFDISASAGDQTTLRLIDLEMVQHTNNIQPVFHNNGGTLIIDGCLFDYGGAGSILNVIAMTGNTAAQQTRRAYITNTTISVASTGKCIRAVDGAYTEIKRCTLSSVSAEAIDIAKVHNIVNIESNAIACTGDFAIETQGSITVATVATGNLLRIVNNTITGKGGVRAERRSDSVNSSLFLDGFDNIIFSGNTVTLNQTVSFSAFTAGWATLNNFTGVNWTESTRTLTLASSNAIPWVPGDTINVYAGSNTNKGVWPISNATSTSFVLYNDGRSPATTGGNLTNISIGWSKSPHLYPVRCLVHGNTVTSTAGSSSTAAFRLLPNSHGEFLGNRVVSTGTATICMEIDGSGWLVLGNEVYGRQPILLAEGGRNYIRNNSLVAIGSTPCLTWTVNTTTSRASYGNFISNNYLDGSRGASWCLSDGATHTDHHNQYIDYSVYDLSSGNLADIGGGNLSTLALLRSEWATWDQQSAYPFGWSLNDAGSLIETGGGLGDPASGDFATASNSVARSAGFPFPATIGAVQPAGGGVASVAMSGGVHLGGSVTASGGVHYTGDE